MEPVGGAGPVVNFEPVWPGGGGSARNCGAAIPQYPAHRRDLGTYTKQVDDTRTYTKQVDDMGTYTKRVDNRASVSTILYTGIIAQRNWHNQKKRLEKSQKGVAQSENGGIV